MHWVDKNMLLYTEERDGQLDEFGVLTRYALGERPTISFQIKHWDGLTTFILLMCLTINCRVHIKSDVII